MVLYLDIKKMTMFKQLHHIGVGRKVILRDRTADLLMKLNKLFTATQMDDMKFPALFENPRGLFHDFLLIGKMSESRK